MLKFPRRGSLWKLDCIRVNGRNVNQLEPVSALNDQIILKGCFRGSQTHENSVTNGELLFYDLENLEMEGQFWSDLGVRDDLSWEILMHQKRPKLSHQCRNEIWIFSDDDKVNRSMTPAQNLIRPSFSQWASSKSPSSKSHFYISLSDPKWLPESSKYMQIFSPPLFRLYSVS